MTKKVILSISYCTIIDGARGAVSALISKVTGEPFSLIGHSDAEDVAIRIRDNGIEEFIRNRVFAVDVTATDVQPVVEIVSRAEFIHEARTVVERK